MHIDQSNVSGTTLHVAYIGAMDIREVREFFLRESALSSDGTNCLTKGELRVDMS